MRVGPPLFGGRSELRVRGNNESAWGRRSRHRNQQVIGSRCGRAEEQVDRFSMVSGAAVVDGISQAHRAACRQHKSPISQESETVISSGAVLAHHVSGTAREPDVTFM